MPKSNYFIKYLPSFDRELTEILYYITFVLENKSANVMEIAHLIYCKRKLDNIL